MKNIRVMSVLMSAVLAASLTAGCQKENSEEPVVLYYEGGTQASAETAVTFAPAQGQNTGSNETEILAPIIADRSQTEASATLPSEETEATESSSETQAAGEEAAASETTASTEASQTTAATTAETEADGNDSSDSPTPIAASGSHVVDNAGVIADESSLNSAMSSFQSDTGINPAIFTINDTLSGDDFRQYARDLYSSNFDDQDHVLIVYQLTPAHTWSWTCVFGTNTGTVFSQDNIDQFQSDLTSAFSSGNVDNALVTTFNEAEHFNDG